MMELFRAEVEGQAQVLTDGLLALERDPASSGHHESAMRAAHSLKGAARIVGLDAGVDVAHAMEDCFVAAQNGELVLHQARIDVLLRGVDLLSRIAETSEAEASTWAGDKRSEIDQFLADLKNVEEGREVLREESSAKLSTGAESAPAVTEALDSSNEPEPSAKTEPTAAIKSESGDRALRVTAESLDRLLGLASESLVGTRWLKPFADSMERLKRLHHELDRVLGSDATVAGGESLAEAQRLLGEAQKFLGQRLEELDEFDRRSANLASRLYDEALAVRMRPFADGVHGFPRMVRDVSRKLGKKVTFEVKGEDTQVDRDILDKLEAPLGHLLRNAIDHGLEATVDRIEARKPAEGQVRLEAGHVAGTLQIVVADDGRGIDLDQLQEKIVARELTNAETAKKLSEAELLEFLFLPGFSVKENVTDISGRGVGLDVVQNMLKEVRGTVRVVSKLGEGTQFQLQLPLTLSVVRTLMIEIGGEPYAVPLANIVRTSRISREEVALMEGRQHFLHEDNHIGLVSGHQILGGREPHFEAGLLPVLVMGDRDRTYGIVVDRFMGEGELVVQPLDSRLDKIKDIAAGAIMLDGSPVLIVDTEDLIHSIEKLISAGNLNKVGDGAVSTDSQSSKRILVVDDSLTVRELERKLLVDRDYEVEVAVDGRDGWNAVRTGHFDLVVTDVDMPRMDGIELVTLIKNDPNLKAIPVMIVSYKDREEDRRRGLDAGADYYLTKASFHDESLVQAVVDLIGGGGE